MSVEKVGGARRRRRPGRRRDERAPEPGRHPAPRSGARPHRRALAHRPLGLAGRQRPGLARPLPGHGFRRRPRGLRAEGGGRRLFRRLRGEDRARRSAAASRCTRGDAARPAGAGFRVETSARRRSRPATSSPPPAPSSARSSRGSFPRAPASCRCTPPTTATPASSPRARCSSSAPAPPGAQIAEELLEAGRAVFLSVGPHDRPPRRYRGRDNVWWLGVLNKWDIEAPARHQARHLRGQRRPRRPDRRLPPPRRARRDAPRPGRGLRRRGADASRPASRTTSRPATPTISRSSTRPTPGSPATALDLPEEPEARVIPPDPHCVTEPILRARPRRGRHHLDRLGDRLRPRLRLAEGRRLRRGRQAEAPARRLGRARRLLPRPALAVAPRLLASSGASGTTRSSSPTISPSSAATSPTVRRRARDRSRLRDGAPDGPHPHPQVQHPRHLPRAEARQRPLPGGGRPRHHDLPARPVPAGPRHRAGTSPATIRSSRPTR